MSSLVYATGHMKDPVPLIEKSRGLSPGGRFPPSFIHQLISITGLNKLQLYVLTIELHRIEMTALSQHTAPGGQSRRVPL